MYCNLNNIDGALKALKDDINAYSLADLQHIGVKSQHLENIGIILPPNVQGTLNNCSYFDSREFNVDKTPITIPKGNCEVYFWGMPGSGKTSIIASLLNQAYESGSLEMYENEGIYKRDLLRHVFFGNGVGIMPPSIPSIDSIQEVSYILRDAKGRKKYFSLIDMDGYLLNVLADELFSRDLHLSTHFLPLKQLLSSKTNPKIHLFLIDLTNKELDGHGCVQEDYLHWLLLFFCANNIFNNNTVAIGILPTKCDAVIKNYSEHFDKIKDLIENDYLPFINELEHLSKVYKLDLCCMPFSLGDFYFKNVCVYNPLSSLNLMKWLQERLEQHLFGSFWKRFVTHMRLNIKDKK